MDGNNMLHRINIPILSKRHNHYDTSSIYMVGRSTPPCLSVFAATVNIYKKTYTRTDWGWHYIRQETPPFKSSCRPILFNG